MTLAADLSRREILDQVTAVERQALDLLEQAARLVHDPEERALYRRLAGREIQALGELQTERVRLEAEEFVQKALDV